MKQDFHRQDKLEEFRTAINYETKLLYGVDEAYDPEKAADFLQQLSKSWKMSPDDVITITTQRVGDTIDKQLRDYVLRFADMMGIRFNEAEIKQRWETLSAKDKNYTVDGVISYLKKHKSGG